MSLRYATSRKRPLWWRRPIDEKKLGIFGTRAGVTLLVGVIVLLLENPWAILALLAVAATGLFFALVIRHTNRHEPPSLFGSKRE
jgi:Flp pilus assembly protein TadB